MSVLREWNRERHTSIFSPCCDVCGKTLSMVDDFYEALEEMEKAGWKRAQVNGEWENYCDECGGD